MSEACSPQDCPGYDGHLGSEAGETVCTGCGLAVSEYRIDHGPGWRSFADDDRSPARIDAPPTRSWHDRGLSTETGRLTRIEGRKYRQFACMRCQHNRARIPTKRECNQVHALTEVRRVMSALSLSNHIRDRTCSLFEFAQNEDLLRGRSSEGFAVACVYAACRVAGVSRGVEEVYDMSEVTEVEHQATYGMPNCDLGLPVVPADPIRYLPRFVTKLDLDSDIERWAREYVAETRGEGLVGGKNPCGVAVACLYTAASDRGEDCMQAEAADVADVTPVMLRKTYVALRE